MVELKHFDSGARIAFTVEQIAAVLERDAKCSFILANGVQIAVHGNFDEVMAKVAKG